MKPNEHPFAFVIRAPEQYIFVIQPTLWELVADAEDLGIYAPDFEIHPVYRSKGTLDSPVPPDFYQDDDTRQWRELSNIKAIALSRYYVPYASMVAGIVDMYPSSVFVYTIVDSTGLTGLVVKVWANAVTKYVPTHVGLLLAQLFPFHEIQYNETDDGHVEYRIGVMSDNRKVRD